MSLRASELLRRDRLGGSVFDLEYERRSTGRQAGRGQDYRVPTRRHCSAGCVHLGGGKAYGSTTTRFTLGVVDLKGDAARLSGPSTGVGSEFGSDRRVLLDP